MKKGNREAEKKRLVEALVGFPLMDCALISRRDAEDIADKLIDANGVIVPPCKVGDTVYSIDDDSVDNVLKGTVEKIYVDIDKGLGIVTTENVIRSYCPGPDISHYLFSVKKEAEKH